MSLKLVHLRSAVLLLGLLLFAPGQTAAEARFAEAIPDLPLMDGLVEQPGAVVFDKPSGRIVEMEVSGPLSQPEVEAFYRRTLPSLGWEPAGATLYRRAQEQLRLVFRPAAESVTIRFVLSPRE